MRSIAWMAVLALLALAGCSSSSGGGGSSSSEEPTDIGYLVVVSQDEEGDQDELWVYGAKSDGSLSNTGDSPYAPGFDFPTSMAVHPDGQYFYVGDEDANAVFSFEMNADGTLSETPESNTEEFGTVSHVVVDQSGEYLIVSQAFDPWVLESYAIDADSGDLTSVFGTDDIGGFPPGGMVMHPSRSVVYLTDTVDDTLEAYSIASDGTITALGSEAAINDDGSSAVALAVAPDGDHVYVVDRGYQEVMGFNTGSTGALGSKFTTQDLADDPRVVAIHPDGAFLYVTEYDVDTLWIFEINSSTGSLTSVSGSPFEISDGPGVMTFSPDGSLLFMGMVETGEIKVFSVDTDEGTLTEIEGSPFASGVTPIALQVVEP